LTWGSGSHGPFRARGLPTHTGLAVSAFSRRYLDPISYDQADVDRIRDLSRRGVVVYSHRSANWVDLLFLQRALPRHDLPLPQYVAGFDARIFHPLWEWLRREPKPPVAMSPVQMAEWRLELTLRQSHGALVFLRHPATLINPKPKEQGHFARAIIRAQRGMDRPIFLVPQVIIWIHRPDHFAPTLGDVVFGTADSPGALRALGVAWLLYRWARIRVGEPVNVREFLEKHPGVPDDILARKLRFAVNYHLGREQHILNGPPMKTHARLKKETLRDPKLEKAVAAVAQQQGVPVEKAAAHASTLYDEVATKFEVDAVSMLDWVLRNVWNRIYDGMEVDASDINKLRATSRKATLVLVPAHRSYIDFLVLSQILYWNAMMPPLIAAGINLAFWPMGTIFRYSGAFFIRRSFKGDPLYSPVVRTYLKHMLKEGYTHEFFIEGARSRTGKTLPPKFGMLSMIVDAFLEGSQNDVAFIPCSIGYEKIIESGIYARELAGGEKVKESISGLLSAGKVLSHKYGRVHVTFDEPIFLKAVLQERGIDPEVGASPDVVRGLVRSLSHQVVYGINRCTVVTPTAVAALALLGHTRRGLAHTVLLEYAQRILEHVRVVAGPHARVAHVLQADLDGALREAMARMAEEDLVDIVGASGEVFYRPNEDKRVNLDYYKNNILHFFVPDAIVATALHGLGGVDGAEVSLAALQERAKVLSRLLKFEFQFQVGRRFDDLFTEAVDRSVARGYLRRTAGGVQLTPGPLAGRVAGFVANLLSNFVEGYVTALRCFPRELDHPRKRSDLVRTLLDRVRAAFLAGECSKSEAVNKAVMENVVEYAVDQGLVLSVGEGNENLLSAAPGMADRVAQVTDELSRYMPRPP
jgi:glycerol-3-phosphate O-acyltransferase